MAPTIVIAAGGTAGHVVPALAVADALRAEGARVVFVGGERAERTLVPEAGYELRPIAVEGLSRTNPLKAARAAVKAVGAVGAARRILRDVRPDAVMGGGGDAPDPARAHRGRQPHGPVEPAARALRPARLPRVPDRGPHRRALPRDRPARSAAGDQRRRRARPLRPVRRRALRARLRRLA